MDKKFLAIIFLLSLNLKAADAGSGITPVLAVADGDSDGSGDDSETPKWLREKYAIAKFAEDEAGEDERRTILKQTPLEYLSPNGRRTKQRYSRAKKAEQEKKYPKNPLKEACKDFGIDYKDAFGGDPDDDSENPRPTKQARRSLATVF